MTRPEITWEEREDYGCWVAVMEEAGDDPRIIPMMVKETKNDRLPFDVYVCGVGVGFKKTLEAAKACAVRQAKLRLEAEENAR